ncbi:MAG: protein-L-isoaspartate(D-aspartate) O-methyltransferase [Phaeodactylibacter sp.]|nr:protein-L-isoaspartate(D-aspartate) O-methyltransferase [Phaeodactylibacter sp.]
MKRKIYHMAIAAGLLLTASPLLFSQDAYQKKREEMVQYQIAGRGITDKATLNAMRTVPRHLFVPENLRSRAYDDGPLPIGYGQTISQPYIVGYMTEAIRPKPDFRVLEIGTGSGYQAAVLAKIVDKAYTIEIVEELAGQATKRLQKLGYDNVQVRFGDGYHGWKEHAPYDAIVVTAAAEFIPPPLVEQLKPGGIMIIPIGSPFMVQTLMLVEKKGGQIKTKSLFPVRFVPFTRE